MSPRSLEVPQLPVERFELACGARLLVSPRPGSPVCAVQAHLRGGVSIDPPGREGTAYLAGTLTDQGTEAHSEAEIADLLERAGGSLSGGPSGLTGAIAGARWKLLLELFAQSLATPTYPAERFRRERQRLLDRLLVDRDDPRLQAALLFRSLVYGKHWLGRSDRGTVESVGRVQRRHLAAFHARNWVGRRALIAFSGDVDPAAVRRVLDRALRGWEPGKELPLARADFPRMRPRTAAFRAARQQVHVNLGHLGIRRVDPDYPALVVMDHILGTGPGFTSRILRRLRDELGLAYTVHAAIHSTAGILPGTFNAYIGTSPEHLDTAVAGFLGEIRRIRRELVTKDELELARSYLTGAFVLGYERAVRRTQSMISAERTGLPDDHLRRLLEAIRGVTRADVKRVAAQHLHPESACIAASGPVTRRDLERALEGARSTRKPAQKKVKRRRLRA